MRKKIPSSTALQAFEAAARHDNFARAAAELALTEGAISRQISRLESLLDCKLFDRMGSRVKLNALGARYALDVRETLDRLERDTQSIMGMPAGSNSLELAVLPTFSSRWLIPRLGDFHASYPDISVNLSAKTEPFILSESGFDAAIHFEHPAWSGMRSQFLFQEKLIAVCHPNLFDISQHQQQLNLLPRIHRRQNPQAWADYARECGLLLDNPAQGVRYSLHEMCIAAALAGQGVALVPEVYVERELQHGELIAPLPSPPYLSKNFCLIRPQETGINEAALALFEQWLLKQIAEQKSSC